MSLNESWQLFPEARIRMREGGLKTLIESLSKGIFISGNPSVQLTKNGILISFCANAGVNGRMVALPIDVLIPCEVPECP